MHLKRIVQLAAILVGSITLSTLSFVALSAASTAINILGLLSLIGTIILSAYALNKIIRLYIAEATEAEERARKEYEAAARAARDKFFGRTGLAILLPFLLLTLSSCGYERIDAGHVGVQIDLYGSDKGVQDVTLVTGAVWYNPITTNVEEIPTYTQTKDYEPFTVNSRDAAEFAVDPTLNYHIMPESVVTVYRRYRKPLDELEDGIIRNMVYDSYRLITNQYTSDSLMANRGNYEASIERDLRMRLAEYGFVFEQLTSQIIPPKTLRDAIDAKNAAVQEALKARNKVIEAQASADIQVAKAKGAAESQLVMARAEAESYRLKQQVITPLLVQQMFLEKWDGKLPVYGVPPTIFKDIAGGK